MTLLTRIAKTLGYEKRTDGDYYWERLAATTSGAVNSQTAQGVSAVYACVGAVSETVASLPLILYRRDGEDRRPAPEHSLYSVLHDQANEQQTALEFREYMQACVLLRGNRRDRGLYERHV